MRNKYRGTKRKSIAFRFIEIIFLLALSWGAIKAGSFMGDMAQRYDNRIFESIDTIMLKSAMNNSLPIIDTIYNSGNVSITFAGEIRQLVNTIFGFDLSKPETVLNANSSYFSLYYNKNYLNMTARTKGSGNKPENSVIPDAPQPDIKETPPEQASSIKTEDGNEKKDDSAGTITNGKITVHNETNYKINIDELLKEPLKFSLDKKGPKVLIYHTHTSESYINGLDELNKSDVQVWNSDPRYNVVRVGEELAQILKKQYGTEVLHTANRHDYPNSNGAYARSLDTLTKYLKSYPSLRLIFDIHRDGLGGDKMLRAVSKINGKNTAKIMFVVGTDKLGLGHPNWRENLKLALKLQEKLNEINPELTKPVYISTNRYNQHVTLGTLIIEVGGDGNTLQEALESMKYVAKAVNEVMK